MLDINKDKKLLSEVETIVQNYMKYMQNDTNLISIDALGSYRRKKEVVGDIDFLTISKSQPYTVNHFCNYDRYKALLYLSGPSHSSDSMRFSVSILTCCWSGSVSMVG